MLIRSNQLANPEKVYNDAMNETPSASRSVFDSMAAGFATPVVALNMLDDEFRKKPEGKAILSSLEAINLQKQAPGIGWTQWLANEGAGMLGFGLNPLTWGAGEVGGLAAQGVVNAGAKGLSKVLPDAASVFMRKPLNEVLSKSIGQYLPSQIGKEGSERALGLGLLSEKTLETFGVGAGAGVPQGIVDNFEKDTGHIKWGGVARESAEMGGLGLAIGAIPFTWGILRGKINRGLGNPVDGVVDHSALDKALEKKYITPEEHAWYSDLLENQQNPGDEKLSEKLKKSGTNIIQQNGHKVNSIYNEALFEILNGGDVSNLHGVIADQLASAHLPEGQRMALSDYIIHNRMDTLRSNPQSLDGLRGYVDFINHKLRQKDSKLAEADRILVDHLLKGAKENMPFSQKELFKMMRKSGFEASHIQHLPVTIPEEIGVHLKVKERVEALEKINSQLKRQYEKARNPKYTDQIKDKYKRIATLNRNMKDYLDKMNRTVEAHAQVKDWEERIVQLKNQIEELKEKDKLIKSGKRFLDKIEKNENKIKEMQEKLPKILTPKEELSSLKNKLIGKKGLLPNWQRSAAYHRLVDLSHVWHNAKTLLDRIHLEDEYNRQEAFRDISHQVLKMSDSEQPTLAKPENVVDYLKKRIESNISRLEPIADINAEVTEKLKVPTDSNEILLEQAHQLKDVKAEDSKKDFEQSSDKFKEFKSSENIFKNLISCVMGGLGG